MSTKQWALVWSHQDNAVKVETLEAVLSSARAAYKDNQPAAFVPLYVGEKGHVEAAAVHCCSTLLGRTFELEHSRLKGIAA